MKVKNGEKPEDEKVSEEETTISKKRGRKKKDSTINFSFEEMQEKLSRSFNGLAYVLKTDDEFKDSDFTEEAKDLVRLAEKYPILANVLTFLDPLFLILGLFSKMKGMLKKVSNRKEIEKQKEVTENEYYHSAEIR